MSSHEEHHQETPKKVYFGIPFAFAFVFWFIVFLSLKACDEPKDCCRGGGCSKEKKECCEKGSKVGDSKERKETEAKKENIRVNPAETIESTVESEKEEGATAQKNK